MVPKGVKADPIVKRANYANQTFTAHQLNLTNVGVGAGLHGRRFCLDFPSDVLRDCMRAALLLTTNTTIFANIEFETSCFPGDIGVEG